MPFLMGAYPGAEEAVAVAEAYADAGADIVEIGIPYADPLADGPVIHAAATHALAQGARFEDSLRAAAAIADRVPVVLMAYANMVLARTPEEFTAKAAEAGATGLIVPDMPPEEAGSLREACERHGIALIPLVAPNTPPGRRAAICAAAQGFVYVVSLTGVTGERGSLAEGLGELVEAVRAEAPVPAAVGFGISTPEQAADVGAVADGVIVGSRLVREVDPDRDLVSALERVSEFIAAAREAMTRSIA
jgi:tryptophan synthase alpha chain